MPSRLKPLKAIQKTSFRGFTLIELMVVVSILAILATIGVTNFQRYQRKARQVEAKALLGDLFSQMTGFHTEWGSYWGLFKDIAYAPSGTLLYNVGFTSAGTNVAATGFVKVGTDGQFIASEACGPARDIKTCVAPNIPISPAGSWSNDTFLGGAEGDIGGQVNDQWSINHQKVSDNVVNGTY